MNPYIRFLSFVLAILVVGMIPMQVRADVPYFPKDDDHVSGGGGGGSNRQNVTEERMWLLVTIVLWVLALMAVACALLLYIKRK